MRLVLNFSFVAVNFQPKCLCRFQKTGEYFECILVLVYYVSKQELVYSNISGLSCRLKLTSIEQVCHQSALYPYFLGRISEGIRQDYRKKKKNENSEGARTQLYFTPFPTSNGSKSSLLKLTDSFFPVCKVGMSLMKWSKHPSFLRMFHSTYLLTVSKAFVKSTNTM